AASAPSLQAAEHTAQAPQTYRGLYRLWTGRRVFFDCAAGQEYPIGTAPALLDSLYREACAPAPCPGEPAYAVLQGRLQNGALQVIRVDSLLTRNRRNNCRPVDFWCTGTEPFWLLVISEKEKAMYWKQLGEPEGRTFPWAAPETAEGRWSYTSTQPETGQTLRAHIRREPCSDGMSDRVFQYSVEIQLGEQRLRGCAE
ncbi:MAG: hypothetical protein JNK89_02500, partial [Saprospiraceae bacterium]|nr:hypothetical protein [Saprospiraceae bacterium]